MEYIKVSTGSILLPVAMHVFHISSSTVWERLIELGLFTSGDVEYIKVSTGSILLYGRD